MKQSDVTNLNRGDPKREIEVYLHTEWHFGKFNEKPLRRDFYLSFQSYEREVWKWQETESGGRVIRSVLTQGIYVFSWDLLLMSTLCLCCGSIFDYPT